MRSQSLQRFLDAARAAFEAPGNEARTSKSLSRIFAALDTPGTPSDNPGTQLPACAYLAETTDPQKFSDPLLRDLAQTFMQIEPELQWRSFGVDCINANSSFAKGHANTMIVGPGGTERRSDVWIGASIVAPNIRYPDHQHPPEETYLMLSSGQLMRGEDNWVEPGIGHTLYNPPGILHSMRSGAEPLFALWALWAKPHLP